MAFSLFLLSVLCMMAAIHPFATYPLTLGVIRRWGYRPLLPVAAARPQSFALCVCAYNEEAVIARKAENMLALKRFLPGLEILVYVDAATDRTAEILEKYAPDIRLFLSSSRHGKTHGMNLLVSQTQAEIVIFTDANVTIEPESVGALPSYFADAKIGCVCGHLKYTGGETSATAANGTLYWRLEERIKQLESDTGSVMGADGSIFAIRRALHRPPPDDIIDDMYVSFAILCDGYRVVRAPEIVAYEQSIVSPREEFGRKIRIACQAFNAHRLLWPRLRRLAALDLYKYISHKFLRWLTIYWLLLAGLFFEAGLAAGAGTWSVAPVLAGALLFLALKNVPVVRQLTDIMGAFAATGVGVLRSLRGDRFQVWSPALSIRGRKRTDAVWQN